jgi:hypothetical protein
MRQVLISDKKRLGFLFGAGSSLATGVPGVSVPAIQKATQLVVDQVKAHSPEFSTAVDQIKSEFASANSSFNVESLLSCVENKRTAIGNGVLNGLNADGFSRLAKLVKERIVDLVSVHEALSEDDRSRLAHTRFSSWIANARRRYPAEIFTTNYDYLFEIALEASRVPYFDGFAGSYEPFFCPEAVEDLDALPQLVKLWKMHGSLGWTYRQTDKAIIRERGAAAEALLIYPSHLKYDTSKKQPYVGLIDRLCGFLQQDDAVLFTCGYSFGDDHVNERIVTSLRRGANSHVLALYYDEVIGPDGRPSFELATEHNKLRQMATAETSGKMSVYGIRHAIVGGRFGEWRLKAEPTVDESFLVSDYFDEDPATPRLEPGQHKGDEDWAGTGRFLLSDFVRFADFLNDLSSIDPVVTDQMTK